MQILKRARNEDNSLWGFAKKCCICQKEFEHKCTNDKIYYKVKDHCLYTGKHKGVVHSIFNFTYKMPNQAPMVFLIDQTKMSILS